MNDTLYYRGKFEPITDIASFTLTQRKYIEITPKNQENFDICSLISFVDAITEKYICSKIKPVKNDITIEAKHKELLENSKSFKIKILNNFSEFHIFVRDGLAYMRPTKIEGINYICFKPYSNKNENFIYFAQNFKWDQNFPFKNSVLFKLGNFIAKSQTTTPLFLKNTFFGFLSKKTQLRKQTALSPIEKFVEIVSHLPGYILIKYRNIPEFDENDEKQSDNDENLTKSLIFKYKDKDIIFNKLIWIMPWFPDIKDQIQYLEIDASFKALKPYAFCIFHGIIYNSSIPIGLSISPTECQKLYELFYEGCDFFKLDSNFEIPVLSDMSDSIIAFCKNHNLENFFCHRHIIQDFGPNSSFGNWSSKILRCKTYNEFMKIREDIIAELECFIEKINSPQIDHNLQLKIDHLRIMLIDPYQFENDDDVDESILESNYYYIKWANWVRREKHIPRCSNHCEGAHGNIKQALKKKGKKTFKAGFKVIIDYIFNYISNRHNSFTDSFKKVYTQFFEHVKHFLTDKKDNYLKCSKIECDCKNDQIYEKIFGVKLKCKHTFLSNFVNSKIFKKFSILYEIDIQDFFLVCLNRCNANDFESTKFNTKSNSIINEICEIFSHKYPNYFHEKGKRHFYKFIYEFLNCFTYDFPDFTEIDISDYPFNNLDLIKDDNDNQFSNPKKKHTIKISEDEEEEENEDDVFSLIDADVNSEVYRLIIKKYKETKNEIIKVYPALKNKAETICLKNLVNLAKNHFKPNDIDNNIVFTLANFKIECWETADRITGENKFLQFN